MNAYAPNFKREGVNSHEDLVWFAKLENYRYYNYSDPDVKQGLKKRGDRKEGEQLHVQVVVSRKDATNTIKLSPMNTSRGRNEEHSKKMGQFDRVAFKQCGEDLFDSLFEFDRQLKEAMAYAIVKKNGNLHERLQMETLELETLELEIILPSNSLPTDESLIYPATNNEKSFNELSEPIHLNITEDVNDEAVYGRDRQRNKPRGR